MLDSQILESFYFVCQDKNVNEVKDFLKANNHLLNIVVSKERLIGFGLFASCNNNKAENLIYLLEYSQQSSLTISDYYLKALFNTAAEKEYFKIMELITKLTPLVSRTLKEDKSKKLHEKPMIFILDEMGYYTPNYNYQIIENFSKNIFIYALTNQNIKTLNYLLNQSTPIHKSIVECAYVDMYNQNNFKAVEILMSLPQTREILYQSQEIYQYIDKLVEEKKEILELLNKFKLKESLQRSLSHGENKVKNKI